MRYATRSKLLTRCFGHNQLAKGSETIILFYDHSTPLVISASGPQGTTTYSDCKVMPIWNQKQQKWILTCLQSKYNPNRDMHQLQQHTLKYLLHFTKIPIWKKSTLVFSRKQSTLNFETSFSSCPLSLSLVSFAVPRGKRICNNLTLLGFSPQWLVILQLNWVSQISYQQQAVFLYSLTYATANASLDGIEVAGDHSFILGSTVFSAAGNYSLSLLPGL